MAEDNQDTRNEVSVQASLDSAGLKASVRSRAIASLDRLIGSAIDIPGSAAEGISRRVRARSEGREALIRAESELAVERLRSDERGGQGALEVFLRDELRKQTNRTAVADQTVEQLKLLPLPEDGSAEDDQPMDEDWLNVFSAHAENASSDHLRALWARILAGEIRRPMSFSLTTLRTVSELDREMAATFEKSVVNRFYDGFLVKEAVGFKGQELLDLTFLEEVGLLQEVNGPIGRDLKADEEGFAYLPNGSMTLRIKLTGEVRLSVIRITRVGREIASILPTEPPDRALRAAAELLKPRVQRIELATMMGKGFDGRVRIQIIEEL